jgi:hypothetical protein
VQEQDRLSCRATQNLDLTPADIANARSQSFGNRFFRCEPGGERNCVLTNLGNFVNSENSLQETLAISFDHTLKSLYFN